MSQFKLSERSISKLEGVNTKLILLTGVAITRTPVDFGISEGMRSAERQLELYNNGSSHIKSGGKHETGSLAIDVVSYPKTGDRWDPLSFVEIVDSFISASKDLDIPFRWGGNWDILNLAESGLSALEAFESSVSSFIDAPHLELIDE